MITYHCMLCNWNTDSKEDYEKHCDNDFHRSRAVLFPVNDDGVSFSPKKGGVKNDGDKPDLSLVPTEALFEMAKALTFGAKKYSRYNFREGMDISRPIAASLRHTYQFLDGQDIDEETQCIHLGNAMAGLAMAIWLLKNKPECDNRYKKDKK